ncbi:MAG TPA: Hsp20/alpha crystallin family protein [Dehalococcoidia bacterium]|nr:Hsp20/alpha crystallin family protein [Dehalococcoidia bacterium]
MQRKPGDIFVEIDRIRERMEQAWHQLVGSSVSRFCPPIIEPLADVYEIDDRVIVMVEIAGIDIQDIDISLMGRTLSLRGERVPRNPHQGRLYSQMEICYGPIVLDVNLPADVDADKASATYEDGILEISLPKARQPVSKQVKVKTN